LAADFSWTPPLVVLAIGAVGGTLVVALRSRYKGTSTGLPADTSRESDLKRRYDALLRRLAEGATAEERSAIELEAARVLMEMDSKDPAPSQNAKGPEGGAAAKPPASSAPTPAWVGFLYGLVTMGAVGGLILLASQGATPRPEGGSPTGGGPMTSASEGAPSANEPAIAALEEAVRKAPQNIGQRIELTRAYLRQRDLMKVFEQTKAVLEIEPGNPHALTYQALVRVAMGQADQAETMLLAALKTEPAIEDAYIHLAIARLQMGNRKGAEEAIQEAQRRFPEDREQLAQVFLQIASAADKQGDKALPPGEHPSVPAPGSTAGRPASSGAVVSVVVDLPKGVSVPPTAILFVIVREAGMESGPPVAVKRVQAVNFPITLTLSDQDSMAGESLPGLLRLDARIDRDGDPLTKDPRDPVASEDNLRPGGGQVLLVLTPVKP
jgi:tetratricopeptide (TPR) repeat protein